jgi:hypothetical protein
VSHSIPSSPLTLARALGLRLLVVAKVAPRCFVLGWETEDGNITPIAEPNPHYPTLEEARNAGRKTFGVKASLRHEKLTWRDVEKIRREWKELRRRHGYADSV